MYNILIVGFGKMGCRHAQSFLNDDNCSIYAVEPDKKVFQGNCEIINAKNRIVCYNSLREVNIPIDFAVIATSANVRFDLLMKLVEIGVKRILVEKVVFQNEEEFNKALEVSEKYDCEIFCNYVNRYSNDFIEIRNKYQSDAPFQMVVTGGDYGLACNILHYLDLAKYLTGLQFYHHSNILHKNLKPHKRGQQFQEVCGQLLFKSKKNDILLVSFEEKHEGSLKIIITNGDSLDLINEISGELICVGSNADLEKRQRHVPYSSVLTKLIFDDILIGKCKLTKLAETREDHLQIFAPINLALGINSNENCPIT